MADWDQHLSSLMDSHASLDFLYWADGRGFWVSASQSRAQAL